MLARQGTYALLALLSLSPLIAFGNDVASESLPTPNDVGLSGNWGGLRDDLIAGGYDFKAIYKGEAFTTQSKAALHKQNYQANYDLILDIDGEKAWNLKGMTAHVSILGNEGRDPNLGINTLQGVSNIAAPATWKVYQLWVDVPIGGNLMLLAGLYDVNSEFDTKKYGAVFINPTHGIGPDFSQTGENGPSIFPTTSGGLRLKASVSERSLLQFAWLDGVPGDPEDPRSNHWKHPESDGYLQALEWNWTEDEPSSQVYRKLALGAWHYTALSDSFDEVLDGEEGPKRYRGNSGYYALLESLLWAEQADGEEGLGAYLRYGHASPRLNTIDDVYAGALHYTGIIPGRDADILGLGFSHAVTSQPYRQFVAREGGESEKSESIVELSYKAEVLPSVAIQFDWQSISNPGADSTASDASIFGLRLEVGL